MNMISQLRRRVQKNGVAEITPEEYDQLQTEWIMRTGAEDLILAESAACAKLMDEVGAALQTEDKSNDYWMGVGAMVDAAESAIRKRHND